MSDVSNWFFDFTTPTATGFAFPITLRDFILHVNVGGVAHGGVDRHSTVLASITELTSAPGEPIDFSFIGDAPMLILSTAPRDDGIIDFRIQVGWTSPLNIRLNFIVVNG